MRKCAFITLLALILCLAGGSALGEAFPLTEEDTAYRRDTRLWQPEKDDEWVYRRPDVPKMSPRRAAREEAEDPDEDRPRRRRRSEGSRIARQAPASRSEEVRTPRSDGWNFSDRRRETLPEPNFESEAPIEVVDEPSREVASLDTANSFERIPVEQEEGQPSRTIPAMVRFGIYAGMSNLSAGDAGTQDSRQEQALAQNFALGLALDGRVLGFLGAELDAYYGVAPTVTLTEESNPETITKSITQTGVMANLKGHFNVSDGFTFKLGVGYGSLKMDHSMTKGQSAFAASQSLSGPFATLGFEWQATENVILSLDYARSLSATGTLIDGTQEQAVETVVSGNYDRIRIGGLYRISPHFLGGLQLNLRKVNSDFTVPGRGTGPTPNESLTQFLLLGMLEF